MGRRKSATGIGGRLDGVPSGHQTLLGLALPGECCSNFVNEPTATEETFAKQLFCLDSSMILRGASPEKQTLTWFGVILFGL
jgi:hypothetical protein